MPYIIIRPIDGGDFNSGLSRHKIYENLLHEFIFEHGLECFGLADDKISFTYKNAEYKSHIDKIIGLKEIKNKIVNCEIIK